MLHNLEIEINRRELQDVLNTLKDLIHLFNDLYTLSYLIVIIFILFMPFHR